MQLQGEFQGGRIDSGGNASAGCDTIPEPNKGPILRDSNNG